MHSDGVCLVGGQPPPVHGMAMVNAYMASKLTNLGSNVVLINLSPMSLSRRRFDRMFRVGKVFKGFFKVISTRSSWVTMYIGLSGGVGQLYEMAFVLLARLLRRPIFLHHHSFAYLDSPSVITRLLTMLGGKASTHIVLCEKMGEVLKKNYPAVRHIYILSNSAVMEKRELPERHKQEIRSIGYLSNICKEKGIYYFLDVLECLYADGINLRGVIAGPFQDDDTKYNVMDRISSLPNVEYIGPKYDKDKQAFFQDIDVFLFPTQYVNEAEPLAVYEALAEGVPVIAWERGCIPEMLTNETGLVVKRDGDFVKEAVYQIKRWLSNSQELKYSSQNSSRFYRDMNVRWCKDYENLLCLMTREKGSDE